MEYRFLGDTGLRVSAVSYGFMDVYEQSILDTMLPIVHKLGVNFFDCAEIYGWPSHSPGHVETLFGNALKKLDVDREDLVISTKMIKGGDTPNKVGLSYKHVVKGLETSLKRLQLDYVDVVFAHRDDAFTSMEEICRGFNTLIEDGKAYYWATSEWSADRITEAFAVCDRLGLIRPIADQPEYSMLWREKMEKEYVSLFANHRYGTTVWSPLCGGILTGKYNEEIPGDSRLGEQGFFAQFYTKYMGTAHIDETRKKLRQIADISKEIGCSMGQLALAWTLKNKDVSTAIVGAKKPSHIEENVKAVEFINSITPEIEERIEKILNNRPDPGVDFRTWAPLKPRRAVSTL